MEDTEENKEPAGCLYKEESDFADLDLTRFVVPDKEAQVLRTLLLYFHTQNVLRKEYHVWINRFIQDETVKWVQIPEGIREYLSIIDVANWMKKKLQRKADFWLDKNGKNKDFLSGEEKDRHWNSLKKELQGLNYEKFHAFGVLEPTTKLLSIMETENQFARSGYPPHVTTAVTVATSLGSNELTRKFTYVMASQWHYPAKIAFQNL
jgi:hypothetical protein